MVNKKSWDEFRNTGLALLVNSVLHAFGWALVFETDDNGAEIGCYPARVRFRGFDEKSIDESYTRIADYLAENSEELKREIYEPGN